MTNDNEQNGRQPNQPWTPVDPRPDNVSDQQKLICRNYIWGTCTKGSACKFRHELVLDYMKEILKFCHDYQNKRGCTRIDCSYLHATSEEKTLFLATGQLPRVLQERYAAMQPDQTNSQPSYEGIPQMMFVMAPPPPPPAQAAAPPPPPPGPAPTPVAVIPPDRHPPPMPSPATTTASAVQTTPIFPGTPPPNGPLLYRINQPPPLLIPMFDTSRPPPPLPTQNGTTKRKNDHCEAGPSRKPKDPRGDTCEPCVEKECRIDLYKQQMTKLQSEEENHRIVYKMKLAEFEQRIELLRSLVSPELYRRIIEEFVEGGPPQGQDIITQLNSITEKTFLQPLQVLSRRPVRYPPEVLHSVLDLILLTNTTERSQNSNQDAEGARGSALAITSGSNGSTVARFTNGQLAEASSSRYQNSASPYQNIAVAGPSGFSPGGAVAGPSGYSTMPTPSGFTPVAGPGGYTPGGTSGPRALPSATSPCPEFHPGIPPPPNRMCISPQYASSTPSAPVPNLPFNPAGRANAPSTTQMSRQSTSTAGATPPNPQNYQYTTGRYPHPHYYPPFQ